MKAKTSRQSFDQIHPDTIADMIKKLSTECGWCDTAEFSAGAAWMKERILNELKENDTPTLQ